MEFKRLWNLGFKYFNYRKSRRLNFSFESKKKHKIFYFILILPFQMFNLFLNNHNIFIATKRKTILKIEN